jgi:peptidoglycan/xylan/chitin deacetylase (PgdA/CDA1 family)
LDDIFMQTSMTEKPTDVPFFKRTGYFLYLLIILGFTVPALIYLSIMQSLGWRVPSFGANGLVSDAAISGKSSTVFLYAAPSTKNYFVGIGGNYDVLLDPWRKYFATRKVNSNEFQDIAQLRQQKSGVLVLPSALSLGEDERNEIAAFRARGGAILATWATGTRNAQGDWQGWQFLESMGAAYVGEVSVDKDINHLILKGESPVSNTHPSGQRIHMSQTSEKLLRLKGDATAGLFMNWARISDDDRKGEGAIVFSETAGKSGRATVFAFAETAWESRPLVTYSLIDDTLLWLQRSPTIVKAAWPNGKLASQVVSMDTEDDFANALPFANMMKSSGLPATFYVLTSVGKLFPEVVKQLAPDFELGFHGDIHIGFKGQSPADQEKRIQTMREQMASVLPNLKDMTGFRAPTEAYDSATEQILQKSGFRHHAADPNRTEGRLPIIAKIEGVASKDSIVVLPRTQRDDINLSAERLSVEQTTKALIDDAEVTIATGALGFLSVHSQNFKSDGVLIKAMPSYLEHLKQRSNVLWVASAGQISQWWKDRERVTSSSKFVGRRLEFDLTVAGDQPVGGASFILMLPQKGQIPSIRSSKIGKSKPDISKLDDYRALITFNKLEPGDYAFQITFD